MEKPKLSTEAVWSRFRSDLWQFIRRRVADDHTADDLLQETFVRIHRNVDTGPTRQLAAFEVEHVPCVKGRSLQVRHKDLIFRALEIVVALPFGVECRDDGFADIERLRLEAPHRQVVVPAPWFL